MSTQKPVDIVGLKFFFIKLCSNSQFLDTFLEKIDNTYSESNKNKQLSYEKARDFIHKIFGQGNTIIKTMYGIQDFAEYASKNTEYIYYMITKFIQLIVDLEARLNFSIDSKFSTVVDSIVNYDSFVFIEQYYRGIGGDESIYFLRDYREMMDYIRASLISARCFTKIPIYCGDSTADVLLTVYQVHIARFTLNDFINFIALNIMGPVIRVQREPINSTRLHTSTVGALGMLLCVESDAKKVSSSFCTPKYYKIDVYRASGAGGQHVNKTSSAVRVTHTLLDMVVTCQSERSQLHNKKKAILQLETQISNQCSTFISSLLKSQNFSTGRNCKNQTFNYKRQIVHFHDLCLQSMAISMSYLNNKLYSQEVMKKILDLL